MITFINSTGVGSWHFHSKIGLALIQLINRSKGLHPDTPTELTQITHSSTFNDPGIANRTFSSSRSVSCMWSFESDHTKFDDFSDHWIAFYPGHRRSK